MKPLYQAADPLEAEIVKDYLAAHGIASQVLGGYAWGGRGDLPMDVYPRVVLQNEGDERRALELMRQYQRNGRNPWHWRCGCGELSPDSFAVCWCCDAARPA